jgi:hypothetical protein
MNGARAAVGQRLGLRTNSSTFCMFRVYRLLSISGVDSRHGKAMSRHTELSKQRFTAVCAVQERARRRIKHRNYFSARPI